MTRLLHIMAAALVAAGIGALPAVAQDATDDAPYQTDEQWLNAAADAEDYSSGDVSEYRAEVRQAARDLASGEVDREEYWNEINQAKELLAAEDDHGDGSGYGDYASDDYGIYDSAYDWETDDAGWDGWYGNDEGIFD